jgi:hypothetical protein
MIAFALASLSGQIAIVAFILWTMFRFLRKAGYRRGQAWGRVCISVLFAMLGLVLNDLGFSWFDLPGRMINSPSLATGNFAVFAAIQFACSPFTLCAIPMLYCSFRKWPIETHSREADVFG